MIRAEALRAIVESEEDDLRVLARLAGGHPSSFYRGANFNDADLRGQDLQGFNLEAATFERVRVDRHTKVDAEYQALVGTNRAAVDVAGVHLILARLEQRGIKVEWPLSEYLGDMLEEAMFTIVSGSPRAKNRVLNWIRFIEEELHARNFGRSKRRTPTGSTLREFNGFLPAQAHFDYVKIKPSDAKLFEYIAHELRNPTKSSGRVSPDHLMVSLTVRTADAISMTFEPIYNNFSATCLSILLWHLWEGS